MKTLKTLAALCLSFVLVCCTSDKGSDSDDMRGLVLKVDKYEIYDNGTDIATFHIYFDGLELDSGYTIYDNNDEPLESKTFSATKVGIYEFWAEYGATTTRTNTKISVVATPPAAPSAPVDNNPSKLNFNRRILLTQFTGIGCGNCPRMINALDDIKKDEKYNNNIAIASAHIGGYAGNDPAAMTTELNLDEAYGIVYNPDLIADFKRHNDQAATASKSYIANMINTALNRVSTRGSVAVNSKYHADKNYVVLTALVKASEKADFRIGAILLENNITGAQSNYGIEPNEGVDFNNHNNCIRRIKSQHPSNHDDFSGYDLGVIEAGKTKTYEFAFPISKSWKVEDLHVLVFISTQEGSKWYVNNVVDAAIDGTTDFEYAK